MNSYKYILILLLLITTAPFQGCNQLLDNQKPVSSLTFGNAYETEADLQAGVQGVYNRLVNTFGENRGAYANELGGDENAPRMANAGDLRAGTSYWGDFGTFTGDNDAFFGTLNPTSGIANWQAYYLIANMVNTLLEQSKDIEFASSDARDAFEGELYFVRAFTYFSLLRDWGDVPIIREASTSADQEFFVGQSSKSEVAEFIANDIAQAEPLLSKAAFSRIRANTGALSALKAHVYAWRGRVLGGGDADLQTAADAAQAVINDSRFSLLDNYADVFYSGFGSDESIFELGTFPGLLTTNLFTWAKDPIFPGRPRGVVEFDEADLLYFENTPEDLRIDVLKNEPLEGDLIQEPYVSKWLGSSAGSLPSDEADNIIVYRVADMILLRAEMLNELNQTAQAIPLLNQIRTRAGLANTTAVTKEEVSEAIFNDRRLELMAEGHLWYDLVRFGKAADLPHIDSPDEIYLPVFQREMDVNPELVQNPFYQ